MKQKVAEWLAVIFGMRKFIAWFGLFVVGIIFRLNNYMDGAQFVDLMKATFAGFVAGNAMEHLASFGKDYVASKTTDPKDDDKEVTPVIES